MGQAWRGWAYGSACTREHDCGEAAVTDTELDELTTLQDGLTSPFWLAFKAHADKEWGTGGVRFQQAVTQAATKGDAESVAYLRMVVLTQQEVARLLAWPAERVSQMKTQALASMGGLVGSRRGPGL